MVSQKSFRSPLAPTVVASPSRKAPRAAPDRLALRPMARVTRIALFEREIRERLSPSALDLVLAQAAVMSEGQRESRGGRAVYCGSTMLTIRLDALAPALRDACDAGCAQRLAHQMQNDAQVAARVKAIAFGETERVAAARPKAVNAEIKVRAQGITVFVDVDVEATF